MSKTVNINEAKAQFSRLIASVEAGEEIIIARAGVPVAKLVPLPTRRNLAEPCEVELRLAPISTILCLTTS